MGLEVGNFEVLGHLFAVQIHLQSIYHQFNTFISKGHSNIKSAFI